MSIQKPYRRLLCLLTLLCVTSASLSEAAVPPPQKINLQFVRTDVQVVFSALASAVGFNIVVGENVTGEIDVHMADVDWQNALNTLVEAHGYRYFWNNDVLVILAADATARVGLEHRVVRLRYADPNVIKTALTNVLSPSGKIELVQATQGGNTSETSSPQPVLVLSEAAHHLPYVMAMIDSLDIRVPQFEIGVKFVETDIDDKLGAGFNWPTRMGTTVSSTVTSSNNTNTNTTGTTTNGPAAEYPIPDGKLWRFGTLKLDQLTGFIEFLSQKGNARLISDPKITVLENEEATMEVKTTIPVQTFNRFTENGISQDIVDYQDLDVGLSLTVTPRLNDEGWITLDVEPVVEEITGYTGPADNQRPITAKRTVKTTVRVEDGETLIIGGLVKETKFTTKSSVFLLGDIPFLGRLFTHTSTTNKKTDLLIFITPRIVGDTE